MQWLSQFQQFTQAQIVAGGLSLGAITLGVFGYWFGIKENRRRMRRLVKRREHAPQAEDFVMMQSPDGAMEITVSKKAYKGLRNGPIEGLIAGRKDKMVLRIKVR